MYSQEGAPSITFHCIECGETWGEGKDIRSYGLCITCFAKWAITKKSCFGKDFVVENNQACSLHKYCGEFYGFKQNLPR
jgi:hypothetical protein